MSTITRPKGHLQVKRDKNGRTRSYYAFWWDAEGKHGCRLGPAHVKDSGRRTPRGAIIWRAGNGHLHWPHRGTLNWLHPALVVGVCR